MHAALVGVLAHLLVDFGLFQLERAAFFQGVEPFGLFNRDVGVLEMAKLYAPVAAITFMGFSVRSPSLGFINGLGHSKMNFWMGVVEGFIQRIGLTYLMGIVLGMGIQGFWYGSAIASYGYGLVVWPYFLSGKWEQRKMRA